jgi:hypothetical protein
MKALFGLIVSCLIFLPTAAAQNLTEGQRELALTMNQIKKREVVAQNMILTPEQEKAFWPLYDQYQEKLSKYNKKWAQFYSDFFVNYHQMTEAAAKDLLDRFFKLEGGFLKLQKSQVRKFRSKLPATLVARYFQIENKLDIMRAYSLTNQFPLIE